MTELAVLASSLPAKALTHDQMLHYADPYYDMRSGKFQWRLFWNMLGLFALGPFVSMFLLFGIGTFSMTIAGVGLAHRIARLEGTAMAVDATRQHAIKFFYTHFAIVVGLKLGVAVLGGVEGIGGLIIAAYWLFSIYAAGRIAFHFRRAKLWEKPRTDHGNAVAVAIPTTALAGRRDVVIANLAELRSLPLFDANADGFAEAWEKKNTGWLEQNMLAGDATTRQSWQKSVGIFNHAKQTVDGARVQLSQLLASAEAVLAKYAIDPSAPNVAASRTATGEAPIAAIKRDLGQRLNYSQGVGNVAGKAIQGQVPWQFAAAAAAFALIMHFVNESKLLRQLKELEGQLLVDAQAARNDMSLVETLITTRLLPQIDGLTSAATILEAELSAVQQSEARQEAAAREHAVRLSMTVADGKQLLQTVAGN